MISWFVTPTILFLGGLLVAVPIVLHLVMRRKAVRLEFPALRFVKQRRQSNRRKLRLRHLLLLLLRCLAIFAAAAALARPSVPSAVLGNTILVALLVAILVVVVLLAVLAAIEKKGAWLVGGLSAAALCLLVGLIGLIVVTVDRGSKFNLGDSEAPVAAVLVLDTSPRMQYRQQNKTRLQQAAETAESLLRDLPRDSDVAVLDSHLGVGDFVYNETTARKAVAALRISNTPQPLTAVLDEALRLATQSDKQRKEVYVFTDLTRSAWDEAAAGALERRLQSASQVLLYLIDVGVEEPANFALGELRLSSQVLQTGSTLHVQSDVRCIGSGDTRTVELYLENPDPRYPSEHAGEILLPQAERRGQQTCHLQAGGVQAVQFPLRVERAGTHHGYVRIVGEDALAFDDVRHFTIDVQDSWPVLVAAAEGVDASNFVSAISPYEFQQRGEARFDCAVIGQSELATQRLDQFSTVCLLDPEPMTPASWENLAKYVERGGGVAIFLGHNARPVASFNQPQPQKLLPGELLPLVGRSATRDLYIAPRGYEHPMLAVFRPVASTVPWSQFPVYRYWVFRQLSADANVVLRFGNNRPAVVEKSLGKGRILTMTTPISDPSRTIDPQSWNELPTGEDAWPYLVLVNEMMKYLVSGGDSRLNYLAGQTVVLANHRQRDPSSYALYSPHGYLQDKRAVDDAVTVNGTDLLGSYRLKGQRPSGRGVVVRGFSVNLPAAASDLQRVERDRLDEILGPKRYRLARNSGELEREQGRARVGREFYPFLMAMLAIVLGLEHVLSNRFYRKEKMTIV